MNRRSLLVYIFLLICFSLFAEKEIKTTLQVSGAGPELNIKNNSGSLKVRGWEKDEIRIEGTYSNLVERVVIEQKGDKVIIRPEVKSKNLNKNRNVRCDLKIYTPFKSSVYIDAVSSDVDLDDIEGSITVQSVSGNIKIDAKARKMDVQSISGEIDIDGSARRFEGISISGDIKAIGNFPSLKVQTTSGDFTYRGELLEHASVYSTSGEVSISCNELNESHIEIGTVSGEVRLGIPRNSSVELELKSFSGSVTANTKSYDHVIHEDRKLILKRAEGDSSIYIETLSGEINISG